MSERKYRMGADVGGTFTDVILMEDEGRIWTHKAPSTPPHFEQAVLQALGHLLAVAGVPGASVRDVAHGTTVATNAVLEHRGAKTALITTRGFRDVLELRRIRAPQMYDLFFDKPEPLAAGWIGTCGDSGCAGERKGSFDCRLSAACLCLPATRAGDWRIFAAANAASAGLAVVRDFA
jgi:N-methylhydantoinase A/oxoprolinase/acetone carboxylase beta subunit